MSESNLCGRSWERFAAVRLAMLLVPLGGCSGQGNGFMDPAGIVAAAERQMLFEIAIVTLIVIVPIFVLTPWVVIRYRRKPEAREYLPEWDSSNKLEWAIWGIPVLIVAGLAYFTWVRTHQLDPYRTGRAGAGESIEVQVVALDWKWLFIYPEQGVASVNELAIPAGRPVNLYLTSGTVMQSFHVPRLSGQIYAMAGMTTQLSFRADQAGGFTGRNTQFNGDGFPHQSFAVKAMDSAGFANWLSSARRSPRTLDASTYTRLARPGVVSQPQLFGSTAPDIFAEIQQISTGTASGAFGSQRHADHRAMPR